MGRRAPDAAPGAVAAATSTPWVPALTVDEMLSEPVTDRSTEPRFSFRWWEVQVPADIAEIQVTVVVAEEAP
jgi:hypothetical protein